MNVHALETSYDFRDECKETLSKWKEHSDIINFGEGTFGAWEVEGSLEGLSSQCIDTVRKRLLDMRPFQKRYLLISHLTSARAILGVSDFIFDSSLVDFFCYLHLREISMVVGESASKLRDEYILKGIQSDKALRVDGLVEKGGPKSSLYAWLARADDYNGSNVIGDNLRKMSDLKTIEQVMEEEASKQQKLGQNLIQLVEVKKKDMKQFEELCLLKSKELNESKEFRRLAIVGKYGVGKTTFCQSVFNDKNVKGACLPRIWVSMYSKETKEDEDPNIAVMFEHIKTEVEEEKRGKDEAGEKAEELVKEKELSGLLHALNSNLMWKKYLILLDDVLLALSYSFVKTCDIELEMEQLRGELNVK
ncbi:hypothetical protein EUTSA_v10003489mg [Eutrema salsugineum]|uniref:NB-ARC domain-containing protein n=1 Tax=Eutrema salsugineum TaxID=72664 RepID=V4NEL9_EUTSA|nr:hypothetical protein EUTSA_v10003489mg [Eutrema salsugineum]